SLQIHYPSILHTPTQTLVPQYKNRNWRSISFVVARRVKKEWERGS
ncbi:unnamed protein product, partial [Tuber aestivum]